MQLRFPLYAVLCLCTLLAGACSQQATPLAPAGTPPVIPATGSTPTVQGGAPSALVTKVKAAQDPKYGPILVDGAGRTLYALMKDRPSISSCYGQCAAQWPPFVSGTSSVSAETGIAASQIGTFARQDGALQVVYNGWPLYYFSKDTKPGDVNGQGAAGIWFVVSPDGNPIKETH